MGLTGEDDLVVGHVDVAVVDMANQVQYLTGVVVVMGSFSRESFHDWFSLGI